MDKALSKLIANYRPGKIDAATLRSWHNRAHQLQQAASVKDMVRDVERSRTVAVPILSVEQLLEMARQQKEARDA